MQESHFNKSNIPVGVMDLDSDLTLVEPQNATYALNIRNGYGSIIGSATNVKGNVLIEFTLPSGENACIGTCEDRRGESCIYFVYNSTGQHQILRYYPNNTTSNPNGEIARIAIGGALNFKKEWLITHSSLIDGKLLYWTDSYTEGQTIVGNPPRVINIERGQITGKRLSYSVYAGLDDQGQFADALANNTSLTIQFYNKETGAPTAQVATFGAATLDGIKNDPQAILNFIATQINTLFAPFASAEFCDCKTEISVREDLTLSIFETNAPQPDLFFVSDNHYPTPLQQHHIDLIKYPPIYEPVGTYQLNPDITYNNVNRASFQFRARYWYKDNEKSAWGPISLVALNLELDGKIIDQLNEIDIDFTDQRLNDPSFLAMISFVEVAFRIGNNGVFRSIDIIRACEIGVRRQFTIFRNDKLYSVVPSDDAVPVGNLQVLKLFDSVPVLSGTLENVADREGNSRIFLGANLENYNCPDCIDMQMTVDEKPTDDCLFTITGKVEVTNLVYDINNLNPPTFTPANYPSYPSGSPVDYFRFNQMRLDGFVVYVTGTNYYAVSDNPKNGTGTGDFEITGVPKGKYIIRVASHKCAYDDENGKIYNLNRGLDWQKTSTYVFNIDGFFVKEIEIDLTAIAGNTIDIGNIYILNEASPNVHQGSYSPPSGFATPYYSVFPVYLRDNNAEMDDDEVTQYSIRRGAISVEGQRLHLYKPLVFGVPNDPVQNIYDFGRITDHNGFAFLFFWNTFSQIGTDPSLSWYDQVTDTGRMIAVETQDACNTPNTRFITQRSFYATQLFLEGDTLKGLEDGNLPIPDPTLLWFTGILGTPDFLLFNIDSLFTNSNKTTIQGQVLDILSTPKPNILMVFAKNNRWQYSSSIGNYSIAVYCPWDAPNRQDNLIATYLSDLCYEHPISPNPQLLNIANFCSTYNSTNPFNVPNITVDVQGGVVEGNRYLKRGAVYNVGIVYEDRANRKCTVSQLKEELYIPFFNEIGNFSKPLVNWSINSQPPDWATHYRIVRTRNKVYRRYLQWVVNAVRYVKIATPQDTPVDTSFTNADATHVLIDLGIPTNADPENNPILFFFNNEKDGAYEAEPLDRIRFITDETLAIFSDLLEFEVQGRYIENDTYYLVVADPEIPKEIKTGWLIEVYSPKQNEEIAFYEEGDTYPIINPHTPQRAHGGLTQNQIVGVQPATGYLRGGDTYWRLEDFSVDTDGSINQTLEHNFITSRYDSVIEDIGRINIRDDNFKQNFYHADIRFSDIYLVGSLFNGLSSFKAIDRQGIDQRYGIIKKMVLADKVLLAIAQYKIQPIYVAKDLLLDLSGKSDVGRSDKILNLADELKLDLGTNNPESVIEEDGTVYGWDVYKGVVWRYSSNGLFPISDYKAANYFNELAKKMYKQPRSKTLVFGGFEREFRCYLMTFVADGQAITEPFTISFDETKNSFNQYLSFTPQYYGRTGIRLLSFVGGQLWLHESEDVPRNNFYGVQYSSIWQFVCNHAPKAVKLFWNIELQGDNLWICPQITTPPNNDYAQGMRSRLLQKHWSREEGVWKADFLRDMNDTSARFLDIPNIPLRELTALLYGRPLRGEVLQVTLELLDGSKPSVLKRIDIEHNLSMDTKT